MRQGRARVVATARQSEEGWGRADGQRHEQRETQAQKQVTFNETFEPDTAALLATRGPRHIHTKPEHTSSTPNPEHTSPAARTSSQVVSWSHSSSPRSWPPRTPRHVRGRCARMGSARDGGGQHRAAQVAWQAIGNRQRYSARV